MADIFVSYTSTDKEWAFWIGQQLEKLGHVAHLHDWEISGGGDIFTWMEDHHDEANHVLCVVSEAYLKAPYSALERRAAQWAAITKRPNFVLPVFIERCDAPTLLALLKRCDLHGHSEDEARERLAGFLQPAAKPTGPVPFPGTKTVVTSGGTQPPQARVAFPGQKTERGSAISNIPINVPRHFLGRETALAAIDAELSSNSGRVAITALHGLRGVGKSTLAAAYAHRRREDYQATWWIRAETESTMRADLVGLGVRLNWAAAKDKEEPALAVVMEQLREGGKGILLIYDNAISVDLLRKYLPRGGAAQVIVTSNAPNWGSIAAPVEIEVWPKEVGAEYLIARTGRREPRDAALALSEALGGLPLAHEQAAAYSARIGISSAEYLKRFNDNPAKLLNTEKDAPYDYGRTVATTFALAIDEAAKIHSAVEPLIVYAALLAPEPIPLFLFSEARNIFDEPLITALSDDGLDETVAALRAFALIDRESIPDERDPSVSTDCIRLHRLIRQVAAARRAGEALQLAQLQLIEALAKVYPRGVFNDSRTWPRARRLDPLALALIGDDSIQIEGAEESTSHLADRLGSYRHGALAAYSQAKPLFEQGLAIREKTFGLDDPTTAASLNNLGNLLQDQRDLAGARVYFERALVIIEGALGPNHLDTASSLNNLGNLLQELGDFVGARSHYKRALAIHEGTLGSSHPSTALSLSNLGSLLHSEGDLSGALASHEKALAIRQETLGPDHPDTARTLNHLGGLKRTQGDNLGALSYFKRALRIREKILGPGHPLTQNSARLTVATLTALGRHKEAKAVRKKFGTRS